MGQIVLDQIGNKHRIGCPCTQLGFEVFADIEGGDAVLDCEYPIAIAVIYVAGVRSAAADSGQVVSVPLSSKCYSPLKRE